MSELVLELEKTHDGSRANVTTAESVKGSQHFLGAITALDRLGYLDYLGTSCSGDVHYVQILPEKIVELKNILGIPLSVKKQ